MFSDSSISSREPSGVHGCGKVKKKCEKLSEGCSGKGASCMLMSVRVSDGHGAELGCLCQGSAAHGNCELGAESVLMGACVPATLRWIYLRQVHTHH